MGLVGDQPICARTAWAYAKSGGRISHALSVFSCQLRQPNQVRSCHYVHELIVYIYIQTRMTIILRGIVNCMLMHLI